MALVGKTTIYPGAIETVVMKSPTAHSLVKAKAEEVKDLALAIFLARQRSDNEDRTSEFTPPKYAQSFEVNHVAKPNKVCYEARNTDPGAMLVEYGAHAGGRTFVLRYKPLTLALESVGGTQ